MTDSEQREAARQFYYTWKNRGDEKSDSQSFWLNLLTDVLGMEDAVGRVVFEKRVIVDGQTKFIDVFIPESRVLIEQKSLKKELSKQVTQSGGTELTPYQQAKRYADNLPFDEKPRWIVVSNFEEIRIHDMNAREPEKDYVSIMLSDIQSEYHRLKFLIKEEKEIVSKEIEMSVKAGNIIGEIYDALLLQYADKTNPDSLKSLNKLCVRLVFCMYAEDSGLFGSHLMFRDYMKQYDVKSWRKALIDLFKVLDTKPEERDPYLDDDLAAFPYVNGGLFADENIEIPRITENIISLILENGCGFDWAKISPTIFGAVFESTLNPETRRSGGMHYTSIENIHKVIDPLFLNDLKDELNEIKNISIVKQRKEKAKRYQDKLASLTFLDSAAGSGNFLTESYLSIRKLENEAIFIQTDGQMTFGEVVDPIKVSIGQFYGIEINDFAVTVGKTALWIAEHQMMKETEDIVHMEIDFLPLKSYANIVEGNALRIDWNDVVPREKLNYIMGNPPFVGARWMGKEQKSDVDYVFGKDWKNSGDLDYVSCWYKKVADHITGTQIRVALVSTNSISQGGSVANLWKPLFDDGLHIDFAYRTFRWDSEAKIKAHVHCVIIGFSKAPSQKQKLIYEGENITEASNINGYLLNADNVFIEKRMKPLYDVPEICLGGQPIDDGNFILTEEEKNELLKEEPQAAVFIRHYMMGKDFINRSPRYCLWLKNADPSLLRKCPKVLERVENVRQFRLKSTRDKTLKAANTPTLFGAPYECMTDYVAIPKVSSSNRRYIPMDYLPQEVIPGDKLFVLSGGDIYHFGVLTSNVHMSWMRAVCGRLKSDYSYSNTIVYNNFPWPTPTAEQREKISQTAQGILDARALYKDATLADLYDELTMPPELRKAHQQNDKAVMQAYGFSIRDTTEETCVSALMKMYQEMADK